MLNFMHNQRNTNSDDPQIPHLSVRLAKIEHLDRLQIKAWEKIISHTRNTRCTEGNLTSFIIINARIL